MIGRPKPAEPITTSMIENSRLTEVIRSKRPIDPAAFVHAALTEVATRYDLQLAKITTHTRRRAVVRAPPP